MQENKAHTHSHKPMNATVHKCMHNISLIDVDIQRLTYTHNKVQKMIYTLTHPLYLRGTLIHDSETNSAHINIKQVWTTSPALRRVSHPISLKTQTSLQQTGENERIKCITHKLMQFTLHKRIIIPTKQVTCMQTKQRFVCNNISKGPSRS